MFGNAESGAMVCWLPTVPMLKSIVLALVAESACSMAQRSVPVLPSSAALVTVNVVGIIRRSRSWKSGWNGCRRLLGASRRRLAGRRRRSWKGPLAPCS